MRRRPFAVTTAPVNAKAVADGFVLETSLLLEVG
jgi:hypothetical protein